MAAPGFEWIELYKKIAQKINGEADKQKWIITAVKCLVPKETGKKGKTGKPIMTPDLLPDSLYNNAKAQHNENNLRKNYDPFSFFALFNYNDGKRIKILKTLNNNGFISDKIPDLFHGIPSIYNSHVDFPSPGTMDLSDTDRDNVVTALWNLFEAAMMYKGSPNATEGETFVTKYDDVKGRYGSGWFTTTSILYEMRPDVFLPLDSNTREFLLKYPDLPKKEKEWDSDERRILTGTAPSGGEYLKLIVHVKDLIDKKKLGDGISSFPSLSYNAWKESLLLRAKDLLESSHQLILTGAPGTGKTYTAQEIACKLTGDDPTAMEQPHVKSIQFHPGYDYSDFIGGLKPEATPDQAKVLYPWKPGVFTTFAEKALNEYKKWENLDKKTTVQKYVFIIDEINRADLSRVFGETFSLLEDDYRYPKKKTGLDLPGSGGRQFFLPENLYIIGTMNDIDRSVESMDFALRRRFAWLEVAAEESKCIIEAKKQEADSKIVAKLEAAMDALNEYIRGEKELAFGEKKELKKKMLSLGPEYELGGAYFSKFDGESDVEEAYKKLWDNHLKIILNEYLRGEKDKSYILDALYDVYLVACKVKRSAQSED